LYKIPESLVRALDLEEVIYDIENSNEVYLDFGAIIRYQLVYRDLPDCVEAYRERIQRIKGEMLNG